MKWNETGEERKRGIGTAVLVTLVFLGLHSLDVIASDFYVFKIMDWTMPLFQWTGIRFNGMILLIREGIQILVYIPMGKLWMKGGRSWGGVDSNPMKQVAMVLVIGAVVAGIGETIQMLVFPGRNPFHLMDVSFSCLGTLIGVAPYLKK